MRALILHNGTPTLRGDYPRPRPGPGEALLRLRLAGICGTDLALLEGYKGGFDGVAGHEYVAEVVAAPDEPHWLGRRVVGEINTTCGECDRCRAGLSTHCAHRRILGLQDWDGAFADYFLSPLSLLHALPDDLPDDLAVFVEPVAAALAVLRDLPFGAGDRVVVFGDGRLGQLVARVMQVAGYDPLLVGRHTMKLDLAESAGLRVATRAPAGVEFDIAIDATGRPQALPAIIASLRPRGVLILKSTSHHPAHFDYSPIVVKELRLVGSRCGPFPSAIAALRTGQIDPRPLISGRYDLSQAEQAMAHARQSEALKVLLHP